MSASYYYSFLTGGLALVCVIGLAIAWLLWRDSEARREAIASVLEGVGHEFRINLERTAKELSGVFSGRITSPVSIMPIRHPQLDGVNANIIKTNRSALASMIAAYDELIVRKNEVREALGAGSELDDRLKEAVEATIKAIATLYLWNEHDGATPTQARSTRSWQVRDWMKARAFDADLFPDMHLRDEVVAYLRRAGMVLTPRPLTYTAHEYYAMQYDRYADPNAPFGRRRARTDEDEDVEDAEDETTEAKSGFLAPLLGLFRRSDSSAEDIEIAEDEVAESVAEIKEETVEAVEDETATGVIQPASAPPASIAEGDADVETAEATAPVAIETEAEEEPDAPAEEPPAEDAVDETAETMTGELLEEPALEDETVQTEIEAEAVAEETLAEAELALDEDAAVEDETEGETVASPASAAPYHPFESETETSPALEEDASGEDDDEDPSKPLT